MRITDLDEGLHRSITESFDKKVNWKTGFSSKYSREFYAEIDDSLLSIVYFSPDAFESTIEVSFRRNGEQSITGEGKAHIIFGAVINHINDFVQKHDLDQVVFAAHKPQGSFSVRDTGRSDLYRKMMKKLSNTLGFEYSVEDRGNNDIFTLAKKDRQIKEEKSDDLIDNTEGWGNVPLNQNIDYMGLRVKMKPSVFLSLAAPMDREPSDAIMQHIKDGGKIGSPFLNISIPSEWEDGDIKENARVSGHEGRNRMKAILRLHGDIPIETHLFFNGGVRRRHLTDEMISAMKNSLQSEKNNNIIKGPLFSLTEKTLENIDFFENIDKDELIKNLTKKQEQEFINNILAKMHELVQQQGDRQSLSGYAFDISRYIGGVISPRKLEKMYREKYTNIKEWGRIVKGVNTTPDVGPNEIKTQAAKFGNRVDRDGRPPLLGKKTRGSKTNVLFNLGLVESKVLNELIMDTSGIGADSDWKNEYLGKNIKELPGEPIAVSEYREYTVYFAGSPEKYQVYLVDAKNTVVGRIELIVISSKAPIYRVNVAVLTKPLRGQNLMQGMYVHLIQEHGMILAADIMQSSGAMRSWAKLNKNPAVTVYSAVQDSSGKWSYSRLEGDEYLSGASEIYRREYQEQIKELQNEKDSVIKILQTAKKDLIDEPSETKENDIKVLKKRIKKLDIQIAKVQDTQKQREKMGIDKTFLLATASKKQLHAPKKESVIKMKTSDIFPDLETELNEGPLDTLKRFGRGAALATSIGTAGTMGAMGYDAVGKSTPPSAKAAYSQLAPSTSKIPKPRPQQTEPESEIGGSELAPEKSPRPIARPDTITITDNPEEKLLVNYAQKNNIVGSELAALLSQAAVETQGFKRMVEQGPKSYFNKYDPEYAPERASILGNKYSGDGYKYRGRGYVQLTGRYNYYRAGKALGLDLLNEPDLAAEPENALKIALWYWNWRVTKSIKDFDDVKKVTYLINGGYHGLDKRKIYFDKYSRRINLSDKKTENKKYTALEMAIMEGGHTLEDIIDQKRSKIITTLEKIEPHHAGYQHSELTMPNYTLVVDTPGELDWYKIGQHFPTLGKEDPHEFGSGESDMMMTFASKKEMAKFIKLAKKLGLKTKNISSSHEHPEIHGESKNNTKVKNSIFGMLMEGIRIQLERDDDLYVLHIRDSEQKHRVEVRGKSGYETGKYDPNESLHGLIDNLGKAANISDLMNGEPVYINPDHPDGPRAIRYLKKAMNESKDTGIKIHNTSVMDHYRGESFGEKLLSVDGILKARIKLSILGDEVYIQHIETAEDSKRMGYAKKLVDDLFREFPNKIISVSMMTDSGSRFFRSQYNVNDETGELTQK